MAKTFDIAVIGAGVLGATISYWLSQLYDCSIIMIDREEKVAAHTSTRNTGVIHRPFYLNPETKKLFAHSAEASYPLWKSLAERFSLPWNPVGTLEVALRDQDVYTLEQYRSWGPKNGMSENELELLDSEEVRSLEPLVRCKGAIHSKSDVSVDFGAFTNCVYGLAEKNGVVFLGGAEVVSVAEGGDGVLTVQMIKDGAPEQVSCRYLINAAGGGSIDVAHMMGLGMGYTDLHFRGDYWLVDEPFASRIRRNIYSVARHKELPFLDPHFVIRADGTRQIGPNAALVAGPYVYEGLGSGFVSKLLERPVGPKLRLFTSWTFFSLVWKEWRSSVSKRAMCGRVRQFIPDIDTKFLTRRGLSGVRSSVIDSKGFVPEAIQLEDERSFHVLNFNSPGATGAPVFSALLVKHLRDGGALDAFTKKQVFGPVWDFGETVETV